MKESKLKVLQKDLTFYERQLKIAEKRNADIRCIGFAKGMILNTNIKINNLKK